MGPISSLSDLFAALGRKSWLILLVVVLGLPAVYYYISTRPVLYDATAVIQVAPPEIAVTTGGQVHGMTADAQLDRIIQNLFARDTMLGLIAEYGLFAELPSHTEQVAALRDAITTVKLIDPGIAWRPDVQPSGLSITVRLDDPDQAATLANALLDRIIAEARARSEGRTNSTLEFLMAEEARVGAQIARIETEMAGFRAEHIESLPEGLTEQRDRLGRLKEERLGLEQQRIALEGITATWRADEVATQRGHLSSQIALVDQDIAAVEAAVAAAPEVERTLTALTRTRDQLVAEMTVLTTQRTEAATAQRLSLQEQTERFVVLETALPPEYPVTSSRTKLALAGAAGVAMAAIGLALAVEILNPAIRTAAQLERQLGVRPVIVVPKLRRPGLLRLALAGRRGGDRREARGQ